MARRRRGGAKPHTPVRRVTMQEIARRAGGVHPSTVSLALRNAPAISAAVRRRIQDLATRLGYRRDPWLDAFNARRLNRQPHRLEPVIAFVAGVDPRNPSAPGALAAWWRGATEAAAALHHRVEVFALGPKSLTAARLESILRARAIDRVVVGAFALSRAPDWSWDRCSAVKIDGLDWLEPGYTVAGDLRQAARMAVMRMRERGYRRPGLILAAAAEKQRRDLLTAGWLVEQRGLAEPPPPLVLDSAPSQRALAQWLRRHAIDAVLSDAPAAAASVAAVSVPWALLDVTTAAPDVAGMVMPHEWIGALAVEQVVNLARANQRGIAGSASTTFVPGQWRDGPSLPSHGGA